MTTVVLVNPPHPYLINPNSQAPLGLMYLASMLRRWGAAEAHLINLSAESVEDALATIPAGADLYGFTATCIDYQVCETLARGLKARQETGATVIGGPVATVSSETIDREAFDSICVGEGEAAVLRMVHDLQMRGKLADVYRHPRLQYLDQLPYPARDLMDVVGGEIFTGGKRYFSGESTVISGSRGCPYDCSFCAARPVWSGKVTYRSVQSLALEITYCIDEYGIREFRFSDDALNLQKRRLRELCEAIGPLDVAWRASVRVGLSDAEDFRIMAQAGCKEISPGIESGDQRVLDLLGKKTTVEQNREICEWATEAGINVRVLLMSGTPGEHSDTPEVNQMWLQDLPFSMVSLTQFRPIPGSPIWRDPAAYGCRILNRDFEHYNFYFWCRGEDGSRKETPIEAVIATDLLTPSELVNSMRRMRDYVLATGKCNQG